MFEWLKVNWLKVVVPLVAVCFLIYLQGCPSRVRSLFDDSKMVTRQELQIEVDTFIAKTDLRFLSLDRQDKLRDIFLKNVILSVQTGSFDPVSLAIAVAGFYGIASAANSVKKTVQKKINSKT